MSIYYIWSIEKVENAQAEVRPGPGRHTRWFSLTSSLLITYKLSLLIVFFYVHTIFLVQKIE